MSISKKTRFEVFKRDGFQCAYCGKSPPSVVLEADHIQPKCKGGKNNPDNLITACFDCNRGKAGNLLSKAPAVLAKKLAVLKLKEEQLREYQKYVRRLEKLLDKDVDSVEVVFQRFYPDYQFNEQFRGSARRFLRQLSLADVKDAMDIAGQNLSRQCNHEERPGDALSYFCGVCYNMIKAKRGAGNEN